MKAVSCLFRLRVYYVRSISQSQSVSMAMAIDWECLPWLWTCENTFRLTHWHWRRYMMPFIVKWTSKTMLETPTANQRLKVTQQHDVGKLRMVQLYATEETTNHTHFDSLGKQKQIVFCFFFIIQLRNVRKYFKLNSRKSAHYGRWLTDCL